MTYAYDLDHLRVALASAAKAEAALAKAAGESEAKE